MGAGMKKKTAIKKTARKKVLWDVSFRITDHGDPDDPQMLTKTAIKDNCLNARDMMDGLTVSHLRITKAKNATVAKR
jgi:hypothetical protein